MKNNFQSFFHLDLYIMKFMYIETYVKKVNLIKLQKLDIFLFN